MKNKIRLEIVELAKQLIEEEKTFDATVAKKRLAKLQEKVTILSYLEAQIGDSTPIPQLSEQPQSLDSKSFREENWFKEPEPLPQATHKEDLVEPLIEKIKDLVAQMPEESQRVDDLLEEVLPQKKFVKNDLEEFAATYQQTPTFERKEKEVPSETPKAPTNNTVEGKPRSINDTVNKGLQIGLNDRLAFVKHLFNDSIEDYTRVLSQINTMDTFDQASEFIKGQVKPDYNYWLKKEEYSERFMQIIEKSFN
ncbi:hypothetical protein [Ulvibacter litoralis]|uniref:Uncharacterized protein n=1 Tax=Ulvibacter litoralis TaxID=227084 RepID=A0A1G7DCX6_9FLAO|nr:hypothetical protein [Ulvibacter litoralis]GHC43952.1 hypothetical protein GCM10008083_03060 [Ulvibacter litoralis]SDE49392.1 hypothetical protein SAMN05421855_101902 [Ulvibacter litoralis]